MNIGGLDIFVPDLVAAAILSKSNTYLVGGKGSGKTLLADIVHKSVMNGEGFYMQGDKDLIVKDLFTQINLSGQTDSEIFRAALDRVQYMFMLIDEINACIGMVQNQFLNIADGYVSIRGERYDLGMKDMDFSLMMATGNPTNRGSYNTFEEGEALIDRMHLILYADDYPPDEDDTAIIAERKIKKKAVAYGDLRQQVRAGHVALNALSSHWNPYIQLLAAYVMQRFLYYEIGGRTICKRDIPNWRNTLMQGGVATGDAISFAGDISQRCIQENDLYHAILLFYAGVRKVETGNGLEDMPVDVLVDCYLQTLMLSLRYGGTFLPAEHIQQNHHGDERAYLDLLKSSIQNEIDPVVLQDCVVHYQGAKDDLEKGRPADVQDRIRLIDTTHSTSPIARITKRMLQQRQSKYSHQKRMRDIRRGINRARC